MPDRDCEERESGVERLMHGYHLATLTLVISFLS